MVDWMCRATRLCALGLIVAGAWPALAAAAGPPSGVTVFAGPPLQAPPPGVSRQADALFFYPRSVTVHVGQSVTWQIFGFHTVTFPGTKRPYPFVATSGKQPIVRDAAGHPFWWSGKVPLLSISPFSILQQGGDTLSSPSQTASSGLMRVFTASQNSPPPPYTLTFPNPGVYHYQCAVHPGMHGVVIVKPWSVGTPAASTEAAAAQTALQKTIADLRRIQKEKPKKPLTVFVGLGHNSTGAEITAFSPSRLAVHVGDSVKFVNHDQTDIHTVTFGKPAFTTKIEKGFVAQHGKQITLAPLGAYASDPPGSPISYDGSNHGNGYVNSGLLEPKGSPASAGPHSFTVTFTKKGTYHYECVIHENMDGTIVVR
jgi:plastocyanin